jgi:hypothetical protein
MLHVCMHHSTDKHVESQPEANWHEVGWMSLGQY